MDVIPARRRQSGSHRSDVPAPWLPFRGTTDRKCCPQRSRRTQKQAQTLKSASKRMSFPCEGGSWASPQQRPGSVAAFAGRQTVERFLYCRSFALFPAPFPLPFSSFSAPFRVFRVLRGQNSLPVERTKKGPHIAVGPWRTTRLYKSLKKRSLNWCSQRDSNSCFSLERATS